MSSVADYDSRFSHDKYAVGSSQCSFTPAHLTYSNRPESSSFSLNVSETCGSYCGMDMMDRGRPVLEGVGSSASSELPLGSINVDPAYTRSDSIRPSSSLQLMFEPDSNWFRGSSTERATVSRSYLQSLDVGESGEFSIEMSNSRSASSRSRCRSPVSKYAQPFTQHSSISSVLGDVCCSRRVQSPKAGTSRDFLTDRRRSVASMPSSRSRSPVFQHAEPSTRHSSLSSGLDDVPRYRKAQNPEAGSYRDFLMGGRSSVTSHMPRFCSRSSVSIYAHSSLRNSPVSSVGLRNGGVQHAESTVSPRDSSPLRRGSVSDVGDDVQYLRSCSNAADQSASGRKRQQKPIDNSSSLLFAKKLAKLCELRYTHSLAQSRKVCNRTFAILRAFSSVFKSFRDRTRKNYVGPLCTRQVLTFSRFHFLPHCSPLRSVSCGFHNKD